MSKRNEIRFLSCVSIVTRRHFRHYHGIIEKMPESAEKNLLCECWVRLASDQRMLPVYQYFKQFHPFVLNGFVYRASRIGITNYKRLRDTERERNELRRSIARAAVNLAQSVEELEQRWTEGFNSIDRVLFGDVVPTLQRADGKSVPSLPDLLRALAGKANERAMVTRDLKILSVARRESSSRRSEAARALWIGNAEYRILDTIEMRRAIAATVSVVLNDGNKDMTERAVTSAIGRVASTR